MNLKQIDFQSQNDEAIDIDDIQKNGPDDELIEDDFPDIKIAEKVEGNTVMYRLVINKKDIEVDAAQLLMSEKRVRSILKQIKKMDYQVKGGGAGLYWLDIICLNLITERLLKMVSPYVLERLIPVTKFRKKKGADMDEHD